MQEKGNPEFSVHTGLRLAVIQLFSNTRYELVEEGSSKENLSCYLTTTFSTIILQSIRLDCLQA